MKPQPPGATRGIFGWIQGLVSVVLLWHFMGLFIAAVAPPMPGFAPSALISGIYERLFRRPLEFLGLTNPHRYYAPGISPFTQAWFRATLADGAVRWMELPGPRNPILPARCQRRFGIAMALQSSTAALPQDPGTQVLTPSGRLLASSYARHVAVELGRASASPVVEVQVYQVVHRIRLPQEVQRGWPATDLRLYAPRYLGTFSADGRATSARDDAPLRAPNIPMSLFAATILREDAWPAGKQASGSTLHLPTPIAHLLKRIPALAKPQDAAGLRQRLVQAVESLDAPTPPRSVEEW